MADLAAGELKRQTIHVELRNVQWEGPSAILTYFRYLLFALLFFKAAKHQHLVHKALYELRKRPRPDSPYAVPTGDSFKYTLTPHYFAEILIYLSLAFIAAPPGHWINGTLFYAVVFVATNLGVTAAGTRKWYEAKFGEQVVRGKAAMIPFIW